DRGGGLPAPRCAGDAPRSAERAGPVLAPPSRTPICRRSPTSRPRWRSYPRGDHLPGGSMTTVTMPQLGETVVEGTITKWLKQEGDHVDQDEPLFEISTDKVDTEVPSPAAGTLTKILVQEGQTVSVKTPIAEINGAGAAAGGAAGAGESAGAGAPPDSAREPAEP